MRKTFAVTVAAMNLFLAGGILSGQQVAQQVAPVSVKFGDPTLLNDAWEHFWNLVDMPQIGPYLTPFGLSYLASQFIDCPQDVENRPLKPGEANSVWGGGHKVRQELKAWRAGMYKDYLAGKSEIDASDIQAKYAEIIARGIDSIDPAIAALIKHHVEKVIWPRVMKPQTSFMGDTATWYTSMSIIPGSSSTGTTITTPPMAAVYGSVANGFYYHQYAPALYIKTALGNVKSSTGSLQTGSASYAIYLNIYIDPTTPTNPDSDIGKFEYGSQYGGKCLKSGAAFSLLAYWDYEFPLVSLAKTYYTDSMDVDGPCAYLRTACTTGAPRCTYGLGLGLTFRTSGCAVYAYVYYLVLDGSCSAVGLYGEAIAGQVRKCY